jgi:hypothetical protein
VVKRVVPNKWVSDVIILLWFVGGVFFCLRDEVVFGWFSGMGLVFGLGCVWGRCGE